VVKYKFFKEKYDSRQTPLLYIVSSPDTFSRNWWYSISRRWISL